MIEITDYCRVFYRPRNARQSFLGSHNLHCDSECGQEYALGRELLSCSQSQELSQ